MAGTFECGNEISGFVSAGNFLTNSEPVSFSRRIMLDRVSKNAQNAYHLHKTLPLRVKSLLLAAVSAAHYQCDTEPLRFINKARCFSPSL